MQVEGWPLNDSEGLRLAQVCEDAAISELFPALERLSEHLQNVAGEQIWSQCIGVLKWENVILMANIIGCGMFNEDFEGYVIWEWSRAMGNHDSDDEIIFDNGFTEYSGTSRYENGDEVIDF